MTPGRGSTASGRAQVAVLLAVLALASAACGQPATAIRSHSTPSVPVAPASPVPDPVQPAIPPPVQPATPQPARLSIPALGIDATVEMVGVTASGAMDTPRLYQDVGWYSRGSVPGAAGDAVIDGHAGLPGAPLVFGRLATLVPGDAIIVTAADGSRRRFLVTQARSWPADSRPTGLFGTDGPPRLSLITCDGEYQPGTRTYAERLIVDASYAGLD